MRITQFGFKMGLDMSWMLDYPALLKMYLFLLCPEPELLRVFKAREFLNVFDIYTDELNKTLLCLDGSANRITFCNHTEIMMDWMAVFFLLFGISQFSFTACM